MICSLLQASQPEVGNFWFFAQIKLQRYFVWLLQLLPTQWLGFQAWDKSSNQATVGFPPFFFFQEMYLNTVLSFDVASAFSLLRAQASPEIAKLHLFHDRTSTEESLLIE